MGNKLIRAAAPRPASLQRALAKLQTPPLPRPRETSIGLIPATLLVLVGLWTANAADFTSEAWPLAVLFALPAAASVKRFPAALPECLSTAVPFCCVM